MHWSKVLIPCLGVLQCFQYTITNEYHIRIFFPAFGQKPLMLKITQQTTEQTNNKQLDIDIRSRHHTRQLTPSAGNTTNTTTYNNWTLQHTKTIHLQCWAIGHLPMKLEQVQHTDSSYSTFRLICFLVFICFLFILYCLFGYSAMKTER